MSITETKATNFYEIPRITRLYDLGKFGRHISADGDKVTILVRDYRGDTRMSYTFEFVPSQGRGHEGLRMDWTNNYWDTHDYCFIPTDIDDVKLADIFTYCEYNAEHGRNALRNAGIDDDTLPTFVAEVLDAVA